MANRTRAKKGRRTVTELFETLGHIGLVPVITITRAEDAVPLGRALLAGGIGCAEITFRTRVAAEAIRMMAGELDGMLIGAGTILSIEQAEQAVQAGARFIVSPGFDATLVEWCLERHIPVLPGVATATEILMAQARGVRVLKFFPAEELGGVRMLKALAGPFPDVRFVPTGGIKAATLPEYLALPNVVACGGSWIAASNAIVAGQFDEIARLAGEARAIVRHLRGEDEREQ
ncbi:MAG TPA: bifunctional 4-hydroxy-2-oxoglutarate aldolase/2-dehydro-3-deoxy-phosphogluconate aldolase [Ktedonobacterales bacterium]|nr:bifunctional 4-hydroxy-2-oxoglutarate aldolase/2-dehydro-3-deoxy-phosphogluconate aldolase [Ktedonobacterales bacterium]